MTSKTIFFRLPNGHVNMEGMWQLAKGLTDFMSWQQTTCPFPRCSRAATYLQGSPVLTDQGECYVIPLATFCPHIYKTMVTLSIFFLRHALFRVKLVIWSLSLFPHSL